MKDEEMAEQFADNINGLDLTCSLLSAKDKSHAYRLGRYDGFLAGLKAGRPQWHDLRKDPKDLPKDDENYICLLEEGHKFECYYDPTTKKWYDNYFHQEIEYGYYQRKVIAWCEIPTFDKEQKGVVFH